MIYRFANDILLNLSLYSERHYIKSLLSSLFFMFFVYCGKPEY